MKKTAPSRKLADMTETFSRAGLPSALSRALEAALDKNARAPVVLRVSEVAGYTDWVLILSGRSDRHVEGITDGIVATLRQHGLTPRGADGLENHCWDLLDYDDFIIHVFHHPVRTYYDLESMWIDAPKVDLALSPAIMDTKDLEAVPTPPSLPDYRGGFGGYEHEFEPALSPNEEPWSEEEDAPEDDEGWDDEQDETIDMTEPDDSHSGRRPALAHERRR